MSIIGLSMAALPCCAEEDVEAGSAALRVDWPVYPRHAEHNTPPREGNRTCQRLRPMIHDRQRRAVVPGTMVA
jgi:hypothetical protein